MIARSCIKSTGSELMDTQAPDDFNRRPNRVEATENHVLNLECQVEPDLRLYIVDRVIFNDGQAEFE